MIGNHALGMRWQELLTPLIFASQAAACVGLIVGNLADWLHTAKAWSLVRVRAIMQVAGSVGAAKPADGPAPAMARQARACMPPGFLLKQLP